MNQYPDQNGVQYSFILPRPGSVRCLLPCKWYVEKHAICLKDYRIRSILSIRHADGDLCKHLGIDSSTDLHDLCKHLGIDSSTDLHDRYSNLFLNAYINRHAYSEYLKMI